MHMVAAAVQIALSSKEISRPKQLGGKADADTLREWEKEMA